MTVTWSIHPSDGNGTFNKFTVPSVQATFAGHWDSASRTLVAPDNAAVRAALPYRLRKAFDRAIPESGKGGFWFGKDGPGEAIRQSFGHLTLTAARGRRILATLYAIPITE